MDKQGFMWITLNGCVRQDAKSSLKYLVILIALMDNFNQGTGECQLEIFNL